MTVDTALAAQAQHLADAFRRAALVELALAATDYQPASYDDAFHLREVVAGALDAEIAIAGDQGEDGVYAAFRTLRAAVVQDLTARGADLAQVRTFTLGGSLPALAVAQRLYGDAARADGLVAQVDPVHPLFMPPVFQVLAA